MPNREPTERGSIPPMATTFRQAYTAERSISTNGHRPQRIPFLVALGRFAARRLPRWAAIRSAVLQVAAVVCAVAGIAILWGIGPALLAACPGLFILEALTGETPRR